MRIRVYPWLNICAACFPFAFFPHFNSFFVILVAFCQIGLSVKFDFRQQKGTTNRSGKYFPDDSKRHGLRRIPWTF